MNIAKCQKVSGNVPTLHFWTSHFALKPLWFVQLSTFQLLHMILPRSNDFRSQKGDEHPNELLPYQLCHVQVGPNCPCGEKSIKHTLESWDSFQLTYVYTIVLEDYHYHYPTWTTKSLKINPTTQPKKAPNFTNLPFLDLRWFTWIYIFEGFPIRPLGHLLHSLDGCRCVCFFRVHVLKASFGIVDRSPLQGIFRNSLFGRSGISCTQPLRHETTLSQVFVARFAPCVSLTSSCLARGIGIESPNLRPLRKPLRLVGSGRAFELLQLSPQWPTKSCSEPFGDPKKRRKKTWPQSAGGICFFLEDVLIIYFFCGKPMHSSNQEKENSE